MPAKILVANRGEIAVRIINECRKLGIKTVAVCSDIERGSMHMKNADEGYCIGPAPMKDSYMNIDALINAALTTKADMIHPGYGFLSENKAFVKSCEERGISFIGPVSGVLARVSDKYSAKQIAVSQNIPVLKGYITEDIDSALMRANIIGYPIMIKKSNGGGGAGIKAVYNDNELKNAFKMFYTTNNGKLFIEKYIERARHIEVQIMADSRGNVITLGTRECSIQQNNKKVLEECPAQRLSEALLQDLYSDSVKMAKAVNYAGVGTLEFLADEHGNHYFMEMNARIQVEHGITEMISNMNLMQWQIRIALGEQIPFTQDDVKLSGHALECRINALNYGRIDNWRLDSGEARFDHAIADGMNLSPYYDALLGKLISYGPSRDDAIHKMRGYLSNLQINGIETNINLHKKILNNDCFNEGIYFTNFLSKGEELPVKDGYIREPEPALAEAGPPARVKRQRPSWLRINVESLFKDKSLYKEAL